MRIGSFYVSSLAETRMGFGWTATLWTPWGFLALRSPSFTPVFSERYGIGAKVLARAFGWRLVWKKRRVQ